MESRDIGPVLKGFEALYASGTVAARTDGELVEAFVGRAGAAEVAFAALVERHGPMVLRVCRGVLKDRHSAEDAFQATFLILARKAGAIRRRGSVASWLYGVARRVAQRARAVDSRRAETERRGASMARHGSGTDGPGDLVPEIQEEIDRLPEKYREPVVLCDLEGLSREEAAARLRIPSSTVRVRLARARQRLRGRLVRRGLAPAAIAAGLSADAVATMPTPLVDLTIRAAMRVAAGRAAASGPVAALVEGVLKAMFLSKLKFAAALAMATAASLAAIPLVGAYPSPGPSQAPVPEPPAAGVDPGAKKVAVAAVATADVARTTDQVGSVFPFQSVDLYARASGFLKSRSVDIGDAVGRGQVVAELLLPELMAEVNQMQAKLAQATARLALAKSAVTTAGLVEKSGSVLIEAARTDLAAARARSEFHDMQSKRISKLVERNAVEKAVADETAAKAEEARAAASAATAKLASAEATSAENRARVEQAKADVLAAEADVRVAEEAVVKARLVADQATIRSPIDGVVTRRNHSPLDFVRSGDQPGALPILTVARVDKVRVVVDVSEADAARIGKGALATVRVASLDGRAYEGTVSRVGYTIDRSTGTAQAEIDLDNGDRRLRPGMFSRASIDLEPRRPRPVLPAAALLAKRGNDGEAECFRVEGGRAVLTRIKYDRIDGGRVAVVEGLKEGDLVVVPNRELKDGEAVEVEPR